MGDVYHRKAGRRLLLLASPRGTVEETAAQLPPAARADHTSGHRRDAPRAREGSAALPPQRPTTPLCYRPLLPAPQPRRTRSHCDPPEPGPAWGRSPQCPGRTGRAAAAPAPPSPPHAGQQHTRGREFSGNFPAPPRRSSPRYSGPGSESRSGLSILLLPLLPGFRPFPRRPTLPALLGRSPRLGTRPTPPQFRAQSRPRRPPAPQPAPPSRAGARLGARREPGGGVCAKSLLTGP